jgi:hypothetical protein
MIATVKRLNSIQAGSIQSPVDVIGTLGTSARQPKDYTAPDDEIGDANAGTKDGAPQEILAGDEGNKDLPTVNRQRI